MSVFLPGVGAGWCGGMLGGGVALIGVERRAVGPVAADDDRVDAQHADQAVDALPASTTRCRRTCCWSTTNGSAAAGQEPLVMHRGQARTGGEADPQVAGTGPGRRRATTTRRRAAGWGSRRPPPTRPAVSRRPRRHRRDRPRWTNTGRSAAAATARMSASRSTRPGVASQVAGICRPANPSASRFARSSRSGSTRLTAAQASKSGRSAAAPSCQAAAAAPPRPAAGPRCPAGWTGPARSGSRRARAAAPGRGRPGRPGTAARRPAAASSRPAGAPCRRDRSASINSGGQRCWWMSIAGDGVMGFRSVSVAVAGVPCPTPILA